MEKKRIIPKLEIKNEHLIKGIQYEGLRVVGDPKEFALKYYRDGADQLFVTDIVAFFIVGKIYLKLSKIYLKIYLFQSQLVVEKKLKI